MNSLRWSMFGVLALLAAVQAVGLAMLADRQSFALSVALVGGIGATALAVPRLAPLAWRKLSGLWGKLRLEHFLVLCLFASDFVFRIRDAESLKETPLDVWALYRVGLVGLAGGVIGFRFLTGRTAWVHSLLQGYIFALAIFPIAGIFSTAWSVYPAWTAYKSMEFLVDVSVTAAVLCTLRSLDDVKTLFDWLWLLMTILMGTVWMGIVVWPQQALTFGVGTLGVQLEGVMPNLSANGVGHLSALVGIVALWRTLERMDRNQPWLLYGVVAAWAVATLVLSQTRSALSAFIIGVAVVLVAARRVGWIVFLALLGVCGLILSDAGDVFMRYFLRGQDAERFGTLSGRTNWWGFAFDRFMERPLTGFGAYAGGRFAALAEMGDQTTSSLHSTYLEALLGIGAFAVLPILVALAGVWREIVTAVWRPASGESERWLAVEALGILTVTTVRSCFTTDLIWHPALAWLVVLAMAEFLRRTRRARELGVAW